MYTVLIIDDEAIIRAGLIQMIDWESYECNICGEAEDGNRAFSLIKELKPNIILLDIEMPELNGFELLEKSKPYIENSKVIVLTGYRKFNYVRKALQLGAFDFLLKPTSLNDITRVIQKAIDSINKNKKQTIDKKNWMITKQAAVSKFIYDIIFKIETDEKCINRKVSFFELKIQEFMLIYIEHQQSKICESICSMICQIFENSLHIIKINIRDNRCLILIYSNVTNLVMNEVNNKRKEINNFIKNFFDDSAKINYSSVGNNLIQLPKKLTEILVDKTDEVKKEYNNLLDDVCLYIKDNYMKNVSLTSISKQYYVSPSYMSRLFTRNLNISFSKYITKIRLDNAKRLLIETKLKNYEVAEQVGILDPHYFTKVFKKYEGMSPGRYRKNNLKFKSQR